MTLVFWSAGWLAGWLVGWLPSLRLIRRRSTNLVHVRTLGGDDHDGCNDVDHRRHAGNCGNADDNDNEKYGKNECCGNDDDGNDVMVMIVWTYVHKF